MLATDYRIVRMQVRGQWYCPIVSRAGAVLGPTAVGRLAAVDAAASAGRRYLEFVLTDGSVPRNGQPPLHCARFRTRGALPLPLELGDSGLVVGTTEAVWVGAGAHLLARARLHDSVLADIVWRGLQAGVLSGVCAVADPSDEPEFHAVRLGDLDSACLAGARVIKFWEEPAP